MIEPMLESITSYLNKTQDLLTTNELATEAHAISRASETLKQGRHRD